ncbi:MAG TPA: S8 family serine peptidase [Prolixibacteraceae bacterium]|nr:S8 family serine peptidase [Prolixibacteraceae bacterium]
MKTWLFLTITLFVFELDLFAQTEPKSYYWVQLKDKKGTPYQINRPEDFLSQRAISRRNRQHILIDETDLPVSPDYLDSLKKRGMEVIHTSKWLNGVTVGTSDTALIREIAVLSFVDSVQLTKPANILKSSILKFREEEEVSTDYDPINYGSAINQLTQLNGQYLHNQGFRGKDIQIAVLDAGFWHVDEIDAFDSLRTTNRILGARDFVDPYSDFYQQHTHGMNVLSCMGGNLPGSLIGTAPDASYYLLRSEDVLTEYLIEEDNWVAAAELADSLGVDLINSSLGYYLFDDPRMNHSYADMNGKKNRVTRGANMAFQKGILVFTSAGNEGNNSWKYIISPSDGENVIGVAAVDKNGIRASFSSVGPAFGGAIKPNVAAMGSSTYLETSIGVLGYSNGTSFSSPVLAGMGACLLQANPYANVTQVKLAIEQSAHQYNMPDSLLGYGIPDFEKADKYLKVNSAAYLNGERLWAVSPNPFNDYLFINPLNPASGDYCLISIYNIQGICLWQSKFKSYETIFLKNLANLPDGFLILGIRSGEKEERVKLIKTAR